MPTLHGTLLKAAGLLLALTTAVAAQDYPNKPVRLIIPFPPGGSNDVVGRLIATHLSDRLGKQVVVDNRGAGAGGVVGSEVAANAPHDGYTLLIISLAHAVNPWLYKLPYDPIKSFTPVAILASGPNVLVVNPDLPVHSVKDLLAAAKAKPGQLQYASAGIGATILPRRVIEAVGRPVAMVPITDAPPLVTALAWSRTRYRGPAAERALAFIRAAAERARAGENAAWV